MTPQFRKVALIAASLGLLLSLFLALRPAGNDGSGATTVQATTVQATTQAATTETAPTTTAPAATVPAEPTTLAIVVRGGRPTGGIQRVSVSKGERVVIVVTSDIADEIHVHGYDLSAAVEADGSVEIPFTATVIGRFEVELEERGIELAELDVRP